MEGQPTYRRQVLDLLSLVAGMFNKLGIGDVLDQATHQNSEMWGLNVAEALKAMLLMLRFIQGALQYNEMRNLCMMDNRR